MTRLTRDTSFAYPFNNAQRRQMFPKLSRFRDPSGACFDISNTSSEKDREITQGFTRILSCSGARLLYSSERKLTFLFIVLLSFQKFMYPLIVMFANVAST